MPPDYGISARNDGKNLDGFSRMFLITFFEIKKEIGVLMMMVGWFLQEGGPVGF
jgi:hypothetical protein